MNFNKLIDAFAIPGTYIGSEELSAGNINQTYRLHFYDEGDAFYVMQRLNTNVFRKPRELMDNIHRVTEHIIAKLDDVGCKDAHRMVLHFLLAKDGNPYVEDESGFWRAYRFVDHAYSYDIIQDSFCFYQAGRAFGDFQRQLVDFPAETLTETIPRFHDTVDRMRILHEAIANDKAGRAASVQEEIDFVLARENEASLIVDALASGRIPQRVTHNDTKINNVLFDSRTRSPLCVIDLDTVMPGSSLYDYGDAIRSGTNTAGEDEENLSLIHFDLDLFEKFTQGFLETTAECLTQEEIALFPMAARIMTLELCARFLADYLDGDVYFKIKKPGHNLIRTRNQIELLRQMEAATPAMEAVIEKYRRYS
ncbi:MAG: aminoglycoside phosphotransferase family protein [Clostridia bacterium]|nr:aminoglycoside phosphotransferase family protein [Clostridia bacterium]